eukprot:4345553-Pyramimonas_sp.AAC.1
MIAPWNVKPQSSSQTIMVAHASSFGCMGCLEPSVNRWNLERGCSGLGGWWRSMYSAVSLRLLSRKSM